MDKAYESFEKTVIFTKHNVNWCDWTGENLKRALDLYDSGFMTIMKERDDEGRRIILCNNTLDANRFDADDIFRLSALLFTFLYLDVETQISGLIFIVDCRNVPMSYFAMLPLKSLYELAVQLKHTPNRIKGRYIFIVKKM